MPSSTSSSSARHAVRGAFIALWCGMLALPIALKIPTTAIAWAADSAVMLAIGLPLSIAMKRRLKL